MVPALVAVFALGCAPGTAGAIQDPPSPYSDVRSVTWYSLTVTYAEYLEALRVQIPRMRRAGFNTVWLVTPWRDLNPKPFASPPVYHDENFAGLLGVLEDLRANGMRAFLGLNYLGTGWAPKGIDACRWVTEPRMYRAFEVYVREFLRRTKASADVALILFFTETAVPCHLNPAADGATITALMRPTLGSLPLRLPQKLRAQFLIGYHDFITAEGWALDSPMVTPAPFDFQSGGVYGLETRTDQEIRKEIKLRARRFKTLFPGLPLVMGELGAYSCGPDEDANQSRVLLAMVKQARNLKLGVNIWNWQPATPRGCAQVGAGNGLNIVNQDGSPRPAALALAALFGGSFPEGE